MNDGGTIVDGTAVLFERLLPSLIERVWSYLTEGPLFTTWLAEGGAIPPRADEKFVLTMDGGDDMPERGGYEAAMYGTVVKIRPPHVLEYTWRIEAPDGPMIEPTVRFELEARGDRVAMVLTHWPVMSGFEVKNGRGLAQSTRRSVGASQGN